MSQIDPDFPIQGETPWGDKLNDALEEMVGQGNATEEVVNEGRLSEASLNSTFATKADVGAPWVESNDYAVGDLIYTPLGHVLRCVEAHTSTSRFTDDLPKWLPVGAPPRERSLLAKARTGRSGGLGVGDKLVVALRFDDDHNVFKSTIAPLLYARGLPAGHATISDLTAQPWANATTSADVLAWNKRGVEVHSHGLDHKDPSPHDLTGAGGLYDQIVNSKATIESWGVECQGWMQPGATALIPGVTPYGTAGTSWESLDEYASWLIRDTYPVSESYVWGAASRPIPHQVFHGADHITISDGLSYAATLAALEFAFARNRNLELMVHSANLGLPGNMTVAEFTTLLDWIVARREEGLIEVLTPSGLFYADRTDNRFDMVRNGGFEGISTGDASWLGWGTTTVETSGGHTGSNFLRIPSGSTALVGQRYNSLSSTGLDGKTFLFEGWARSNGASQTVARVLLQSYPSTALLNLSLTTAIPTGATWVPVRHAFSIPPEVTELGYYVARNSGDGIDWDDISVKLV